MTEKLSVIIFTNQTKTIEIITLALENSEFSVVGASDSVENVRTLISQKAADFLVIDMDTHCDELNRAIHQLKIASPRTRVLVMQKQCDRENIFNIIKAGADIFLPTSLDLDGLPDILSSLLAGELFLPSFVAASILEKINIEEQSSDMFSANITERERSLLQFFSQGCSQTKAAEALGISETTVNACINNVLQKIHFMDIAQQSYDNIIVDLPSEFELL